MLKPWRDVMEPNDDVADDRYSQAQWAADLGQVVNGKDSSEYSDPVEFFSRTYLTDGLKNLLVSTLRRLTTGRGEPVVQLKISFGGGKTHSLLALYHLFGGAIRAEQSSAVREILQAAQVERLPRVNTAVIVGTWTNPLKSTLWGEIAAQLSRATGKPELYELIRLNDEQKTSPGVATLQKLFEDAGACLILIDELVAYGRKLKRGEVDGGGTFGNLLTFIQELTEAAKACTNCAVVVSIPESDAEVGDDLGRETLRQVETYFKRLEFVWSPATPEEGYEIVRRRLFKECRDERAREETCKAYFNMYKDNANDFPYESRQPKFRERLLSCYPIHPKLFDYLYERWSSLDKFQKTRGVLRLMAKVIHELWTSGDTSLMIMPGNMPLNADSVREELVSTLSDKTWDTIVNSEVDGARSKARELDATNTRSGRVSAARKITRTIFMGTAPVGRSGDGRRGLDKKAILLGATEAQAGENLPIYSEALATLKDSLYYLYSQDSQYWFGVHPTLRKWVDDKRETFSDDDIDYEIEKWLATWQRRAQAKTVHICPKTSEDVPDVQTARLVILAPKYSLDTKGEAQKILEHRGTKPRMHKNMLTFLSADAEGLRHLRKTVRDFLAWSAVCAEVDALNLDRQQIKDAEGNRESARKDFYNKLSQTYSKAFAPRSDVDLIVIWDEYTLNCTTEDNIAAAFAAFKRDDNLIESMSAENLRRLLDEYEFICRDGVDVDKLWEYFTTLYYMPRLVDKNVLLEAIRKGVEAKTFALSEDGQRLLKNVAPPETAETIKSSTEETIQSAQDDSPEEEPEPEEKLSTRFYMDTKLDRTRYGKIVRDCMTEIIEHLEALPGAQASVRLVVSIDVPDGIPTEIEDMVADNCRTFKVDNFGFEP